MNLPDPEKNNPKLAPLKSPPIFFRNFQGLTIHVSFKNFFGIFFQGSFDHLIDSHLQNFKPKEAPSLVSQNYPGMTVFVVPKQIQQNRLKRALKGRRPKRQASEGPAFINETYQQGGSN